MEEKETKPITGRKRPLEVDSDDPQLDKEDERLVYPHVSPNQPIG